LYFEYSDTEYSDTVYNDIYSICVSSIDENDLLSTRIIPFSIKVYIYGLACL